jgi:TRAP-type C4-dicarboxylate transport system permease large subunit
MEEAGYRRDYAAALIAAAGARPDDPAVHPMVIYALIVQLSVGALSSPTIPGFARLARRDRAHYRTSRGGNQTRPRRSRAEWPRGAALFFRWVPAIVLAVPRRW